MNHRNKITASFLAAIGVIAISGSALAASFYEVAPQRDIDLCVSEIRNHADYTGAVQVRHEVESSKRKTIGFSLTIDTSVYVEKDGKAVREYKAICVVTGGKTPLKFTIKAVGDSA